MKKFFEFKGTINGSTFVLRFLFMIVLSLPFFILCIMWGFSLVFNYADIDLSSFSSLSFSESNAIGEKAGEKIAKEIQELGTIKWFSKNLGFVWIASLFMSVVPLIWFGLSTYYKIFFYLVLKNSPIGEHDG